MSTCRGLIFPASQILPHSPLDWDYFKWLLKSIPNFHYGLGIQRNEFHHHQPGNCYCPHSVSEVNLGIHSHTSIPLNQHPSQYLLHKATKFYLGVIQTMHGWGSQEQAISGGNWFLFSSLIRGRRKIHPGKCCHLEGLHIYPHFWAQSSVWTCNDDTIKFINYNIQL